MGHNKKTRWSLEQKEKKNESQLWRKNWLNRATLQATNEHVLCK